MIMYAQAPTFSVSPLFRNIECLSVWFHFISELIEKKCSSNRTEMKGLIHVFYFLFEVVEYARHYVLTSNNPSMKTFLDICGM